LDNLEKSWATCIDNQDALNVFSVKDDEYFNLGVFQQTKKVYDAVKTAIIKLLPPEEEPVADTPNTSRDIKTKGQNFSVHLPPRSETIISLPI
jgi:hypothetical protein